MARKLQSSRSELKFVVTEDLAVEIRAFLNLHMQPDLNMKADGEVPGYQVCSVYMDSATDSLYFQTIQGQKNRYKLRVRIYDHSPSAPAFLEIKSREGKTIKKKRATLTKQAAVNVLSGRKVTPNDLFDPSPSIKQFRAFQRFVQLRDRIDAVGKTYVHYFREAYVSPEGPSWRATFDRRLRAFPYEANSALVIPSNSLKTQDYDNVVFELKFTDRFPSWMRDLVRTFNLVDTSFPKYCRCHETVGEGKTDSDSFCGTTPVDTHQGNTRNSGLDLLNS